MEGHIYNATKHHVYRIFQTLNLEYHILFNRTLNIPCNGNKPKQFTHCKLQRCQTLQSDTQIAAETVRPSNQ